MNNSFLKEFSAAGSQRKKRQKMLIGSVVVLFFALVFGGYKGINAYAERRVRERQAKASSLNQVSDLGKTTLQPTPTPTPTPTTTPTSTTPTTPAVDINALDAKLCGDIIKNSQSLSASWSALYYSSWKSWNENYAGMYDTPEALASKQFYKDHTQKLFNDLIISNDPSMQKMCHSNTSLRDILVMPDYNAWQ